MPRSCPCGCGGTVARGCTYARCGCNGRMRFKAMTLAERRANMAKFYATCSPEQRQEWGSKGGRSSDLTLWGGLLEQWQSMSPRDALRAAYKRGYNAGLLRRRRAERAAA